MFSDMLQLTLLTGRLKKVCLIQALLLYEAIQQYDDFLRFLLVRLLTQIMMPGGTAVVYGWLHA